MTRPRALTSTFKSVIALLTALLISVVGATALPAAALAGNSGQAKGHQADRADKPGKAHQQDKAQQSKASTASKSQSSGKTQERGSSAKAQEAREGSAAREGPAACQDPGDPAGPRPVRTGPPEQVQHWGVRQQVRQPPPAARPGSGDPNGQQRHGEACRLWRYQRPRSLQWRWPDADAPQQSTRTCPVGSPWSGSASTAAGLTSAVTFEQHAPTRGGSAHHDSVPLDNDSHAGGGSTAGYDGVARLQPRLRGLPAPRPRLPRQADHRERRTRRAVTASTRCSGSSPAWRR